MWNRTEGHVTPRSSQCSVSESSSGRTCFPRSGSQILGFMIIAGSLAPVVAFGLTPPDFREHAGGWLLEVNPTLLLGNTAVLILAASGLVLLGAIRLFQRGRVLLATCDGVRHHAPQPAASFVVAAVEGTRSCRNSSRGAAGIGRQPASFTAACAAAKRAMGTRKGEQLT